MIIRNLKYKIKSREFKKIFILSLIFYIGLFVLIKNEFFYNAVQYNLKYIGYYINKYLGGNVYDLIYNDSVLMYIEGDTKNIFSSLYLYVASFNNNIFIFFMIFMSIMTFHLISTKYYCEIFNGFSIPQITRIGKKKYIANSIITSSLYFGLVISLPRLCYLILLSIFFPTGVSATHFIDSVSFISDKFLYVGYNCSPYIMIGLDLLMSFVFGIILALISLTIVSLIKNRALSYLVYLLVLVFLSIIPWYFSKIPFIYYSSIFHYFSNFYEYSKELNVMKPLIPLLIFFFINLITTSSVLYKKVVDSI